MKMNLLKTALTLFAGQWVINQIYNEAEKAFVTEKAYEYAKKRGKPVLDFGCGSFPRGDYNVDVTPRKAKNFIKIQAFDKPRLPFPDKHFASALCYHVLEHTNDPQHTLKELNRVAEKVFIITPNPFWWRTWLHFGHKWIFIGNTYFPNPLLQLGENVKDCPLLYPE